MDLATLQQFRDAFSLFREGLGAVRDAKAMLSSVQQEAVDDTLDRANCAASLAEAQMAKALGYPLCECTFPPQIMLLVATTHGRERRCPTCGFTTEHHKPLPRTQGGSESWMGR